MKGFISITIILAIAIASVISLGFYGSYIKQQVELGATILTTELTDTIGTFRTNVNTSLGNLNADLSNTTSTDPGHKHTTSTVSGLWDAVNKVVDIIWGGTGTSTTPTVGQLLIGDSTGYDFTNAIPNCTTATTSLKYASTTRTWSCLTSTFVDTTSDQSIGGIKTFTSIPVLPASDPSTDNQAVRKKYVDDRIGSFAGVIPNIATTTSATFDTTISTNSTPSLIILHYYIQGDDSGGGTTALRQRCGIAAYEGATNKFIMQTSKNDYGSGAGADNNSCLTLTGKLAGVSGTLTAGVIGTGTDKGIKITVSIQSVGSSSFVIRRLVETSSSASSNARANISYEVYY